MTHLFQDMQALYVFRTAKEELKIANLVKEEARAVERHEWERKRFKWDRHRRDEEEELHFAKMQELGVDIEHITRRRPDDVPPPLAPASQ